MSKDKIESFKKSWLEEIAKIEKQAIDSRGDQAFLFTFDCTFRHLFFPFAGLAAAVWFLLVQVLPQKNSETMYKPV